MAIGEYNTFFPLTLLVLTCDVLNAKVKYNNNHLTASFSRITWVSRYQKGKTNLDFTGARDSEWQ